MKRQIIKTRPVQPYRAARIVFAVIIVALLGALAYVWLAPRAHPAHAGLASRTTAQQDLPIFCRKSRTPAILS
jgi:hypothetical protein